MPYFLRNSEYTSLYFHINSLLLNLAETECEVPISVFTGMRSRVQEVIKLMLKEGLVSNTKQFL